MRQSKFTGSCRVVLWTDAIWREDFARARYEADGLLAKDDRQNPLNDFNLHKDEVRGPHYHVTPGKFPHIIGGYWGEVDPMNGRARRQR